MFVSWLSGDTGRWGIRGEFDHTPNLSDSNDLFECDTGEEADEITTLAVEDTAYGAVASSTGIDPEYCKFGLEPPLGLDFFLPFCGDPLSLISPSLSLEDENIENRFSDE